MKFDFNDGDLLEYETKCCEKVAPEKKKAAAVFMNALLKKYEIDELGFNNAFNLIKHAVDNCKDDDWMGYIDDENHKEELEKYGRVLIPYMFHFNFGRRLRNELRTNGFSEKSLGIPNLDYIYSSIIVESIKLG